MVAHAICFDFYTCRQLSTMEALPAKALLTLTLAGEDYVVSFIFMKKFIILQKQDRIVSCESFDSKFDFT